MSGRPFPWMFAGQVATPEWRARMDAEDAGRLSEREAAMRRLEASPSPVMQQIAASLRKVGGSTGAVCQHGIDTSAGCGRCLHHDDITGAALAARFEATR